LGLNPNTTLIGFGAETVSNRRKGIDLLLHALKLLPRKDNVECLVFGDGKIAADRQAELPRLHQLGFIREPDKLRLVYSACDFVVVPSREDNQTQVGLEAMACGTPAVGFDIPGVSEYILPGVTGWLAKREDTADLAHQMNKFIADPASRNVMSERCRQMMEREFDIVKQAWKYRDLYQRLWIQRLKRAA
jgi:glycosyltransferase involved in cell wall biosynthesis